MARFFVKAHSFKQYKSQVIEAQKEEQALTFYKNALEQGFVPTESEEIDYDIGVDDE